MHGHHNCGCWVHRVASWCKWLGLGYLSLRLYLGLYVSHTTGSRVTRHVRKLKDGGGLSWDPLLDPWNVAVDVLLFLYCCIG